MSKQWMTVKADVTKQHDDIMNYVNNQIQNDINLLKQSLSNYVKKGGVSQNPANDGDYTTMIQLYQKINDKKLKYKKLNSDLSGKIREISTAGDMGRILAENGELQARVSELEKQVKTSNDDVQSSELRDELLRSKDSNITKHQVFMLGRPLRPTSIPYLWALSILFIGASLLVFQTQGPPILEPMYIWFSMASSPASFFLDTRMWMILSGAFAIVILFLGLRVGKVI
jgi:hypothetical protein